MVARMRDVPCGHIVDIVSRRPPRSTRARLERRTRRRAASSSRRQVRERRVRAVLVTACYCCTVVSASPCVCPFIILMHNVALQYESVFVARTRASRRLRRRRRRRPRRGRRLRRCFVECEASNGVFGIQGIRASVQFDDVWSFSVRSHLASEERPVSVASRAG